MHGYVLFIKLFEIVPFSWEVPPAGDLSSKAAWSDGASRTGAMQGARLAMATPPMMAVAPRAAELGKHHLQGNFRLRFGLSDA